MSTRTVAGTLEDAEGTDLTGTITFRPSQPLYDLDGNRIVGTAPITATLASGAFSVTLFATDDATTTPDGATYTISEDLTGADGTAIRRSYKAEIPAGSGTLRYEDLVEVTTQPSYSYATSAALDAHTSDTDGAHAASAISLSAISGIAATTAQGGIAEVKGELDDHTGDTTAAHAASAISVSGLSWTAADDVAEALAAVPNVGPLSAFDSVLTAAGGITWSTTWADASGLSCTIAASEGDVLDIVCCLPARNGSNRDLLGNLVVGGTTLATETTPLDRDTDGIARSHTESGGMVTMAILHTVTAGQISGGNVTVQARWCASAAVGAAGWLTLKVINLR
jgi:hypothetical protein